MRSLRMVSRSASTSSGLSSSSSSSSSSAASALRGRAGATSSSYLVLHDQVVDVVALDVGVRGEVVVLGQIFVDLLDVFVEVDLFVFVVEVVVGEVDVIGHGAALQRVRGRAPG